MIENFWKIPAPYPLGSSEARLLRDYLRKGLVGTDPVNFFKEVIIVYNVFHQCPRERDIVVKTPSCSI